MPDKNYPLSFPLREWPEAERPREKLLRFGSACLSEAELLAILIRTGNRDHSAMDLSHILLRQAGDLHQLAASDHQVLSRIKGIGPVKAITLSASFEIGRRLASSPLPERLKINEPEVVYKKYEPLLAHLRREIFSILILNSANILIRDVQISEGILNASLVHPREVFRAAILESAASIILLHNHPSGEVTPSREDHSITQRLVEAGRLLNIPVLDHIIIGRKKYFSFKEAGLLG